MMSGGGMAKRKEHREKKEKQIHTVNLRPQTPRQDQLMQAISDNQMVITCGYPGTGKTYVPTVMACNAFLKGEIDKIFLTRPNVAAGRSLGFRPGDMMEKMAEWFSEIFQIMRHCLTPGFLDVSLKRKNIEIVPFETMRGRSFRDGVVLLDEAQNTTPKEMKMFVTRIGDAKVIANGDVLQSDLSQTSGLNTVMEISRKYNMHIPVIEFGASDIVRGDLCREWIINWMDWEKQ